MSDSGSSSDLDTPSLFGSEPEPTEDASRPDRHAGESPGEYSGGEPDGASGHAEDEASAAHPGPYDQPPVVETLPSGLDRLVTRVPARPRSWAMKWRPDQMEAASPEARHLAARAGSEVATDGGPDPKPDLKPDPNSNSKSESNSESNPDSNAEPIPEALPEANEASPRIETEPAAEEHPTPSSTTTEDDTLAAQAVTVAEGDSEKAEPSSLEVDAEPASVAVEEAPPKPRTGPEDEPVVVPAPETFRRPANPEEASGRPLAMMGGWLVALAIAIAWVFVGEGPGSRGAESAASETDATGLRTDDAAAGEPAAREPAASEPAAGELEVLRGVAERQRAELEAALVLVDDHRRQAAELKAAEAREADLLAEIRFLRRGSSTLDDRGGTD